MTAAYVRLCRSGLVQERIAAARQLLSPCRLCPRQCGVDRLAGERGFCGGGLLAEVASCGPHFGEEDVLVGASGSGTIFFCGCNLRCDFCQNFSLSRCRDDDCQEVSGEQLAAAMLSLQEMGCANINLVTPSHVMPQILAALPEAVAAGLSLPLVYNCGGYESVEALRLLDGIVDVYLPDAKFLRRESAIAHAGAADYPAVLVRALKEMQHQVGDLRIDADGVARRGLLVRHLLMPGAEEEAAEIFALLAREVSSGCYVNIMDQFRPCGEWSGADDAAIDSATHRRALQAAFKAGLRRLARRDSAALLRRLFGA